MNNFNLVPTQVKKELKRKVNRKNEINMVGKTSMLYSSKLLTYICIEEEVGALSIGLGPNLARDAVINAVELASYDQMKQTILKISDFTRNVFTHLLSGLGAGSFCCIY